MRSSIRSVLASRVPHVRHERNKEADKPANNVMDARRDSLNRRVKRSKRCSIRAQRSVGRLLDRFLPEYGAGFTNSIHLDK
jgi:hypothetical protein